MALRWMVRFRESGEVVGYWPTREAAMTRGGQGWWDPDVSIDEPVDGLPHRFEVEPVEVEDLTGAQRRAVAYLAANADDGCHVCVGRQLEVLAGIWCDVDWPAEVAAVVGREHG